MSNVMTISKQFAFEAAHRLTNVAPDHKCARLHGHSFRVEVSVTGRVDPQLGWVMDFSQMTAAFKPLLDLLDHSYLNDIEGLENPTSENLAMWLRDRLQPNLPQLSKIIVRETCTSACELIVTPA